VIARPGASSVEAPKTSLLQAVATANRCRIIWSKDVGLTTVVGFEGDLDAVELLFTSLLVQASAAMVPFLAARQQAVDDAVDEMFGDTLRRGRSVRATDAEDWASGRAAADLASLHNHAPVRQ